MQSCFSWEQNNSFGSNLVEHSVQSWKPSTIKPVLQTQTHGLRAWFTNTCGRLLAFLHMRCTSRANWTSHLLIRFSATAGVASDYIILHNSVVTKQLLQVLQLCACVLATLQTAWLCAHRLIRTSFQHIWPLTERVCVYNVLLLFNFFSMLSASHFTWPEGDKGGSLYFMKLNKCHSANTQDGEGTQHFIYISYQKQKQKKKKEKPPSPTWTPSSCRRM